MLEDENVAKLPPILQGPRPHLIPPPSPSQGAPRPPTVNGTKYKYWSQRLSVSEPSLPLQPHLLPFFSPKFLSFSSTAVGENYIFPTPMLFTLCAPRLLPLDALRLLPLDVYSHTDHLPCAAPGAGNTTVIKKISALTVL